MIMLKESYIESGLSHENVLRKVLILQMEMMVL